MTIVRKGTRLNVPESWFRMTFIAQMDYLCDTHQCKDHKAARELLGKPEQSFSAPAAARLPYADN